MIVHRAFPDPVAVERDRLDSRNVVEAFRLAVRTADELI
jgi:hypothetical protein